MFFSLKAFLRKHPKLSTRTAEPVTGGRAIVTEVALRKWFKEAHDYLEENYLLNILSDPRRILNADEASFQLCPKSGRVIGPRGWKDVYKITQ